jgi:hypothetical protein
VQTLRKMARGILVLSSWISVIMVMILALPMVLFFGAIIFISPFQFIYMWFADASSGGAGLNHSNDWWLNPLAKVTDGHGLVIFLGIIVYLILLFALMGYHALVWDKFEIDSPLQKR